MSVATPRSIRILNLYFVQQFRLWFECDSVGIFSHGCHAEKKSIILGQMLVMLKICPECVHLTAVN